jgi:1,2-diacylglycerol 3-alpha-glucosyltransferase
MKKIPRDYRTAFFTNTWHPFVGGVTNSVQLYHDYLTKQGLNVVIYAPTYGRELKDGKDVRRLPSISQFLKTDFSLPLPVDWKPIQDFRQEAFDLVHVHHPFLLGETGMRMARQHRLPLIFTYHTQYEQYTHYVPVPEETARRTIIDHSAQFCNLCDLIIAPTSDIEKMLRSRNVATPIEVLPTGIELVHYREADGSPVRGELGIDTETPLLLHVGRLAQEKNLEYLMQACLRVLNEKEKPHLLIIGEGGMEEPLKQMAAESPAADRIHFMGRITGKKLAAAYKAADLFVFASLSETQGMVIAEAMGAETPVVALDANGVREVLRDGENGRMLPEDTSEAGFADAVMEALEDDEKRAAWRDASLKTAEKMDMPLLAEKLAGIYESMKRMPAHRLKAETMSFGLIRNYFESVWQDISAWFSQSGEQ